MNHKRLKSPYLNYNSTTHCPSTKLKLKRRSNIIEMLSILLTFHSLTQLLNPTYNFALVKKCCHIVTGFLECFDNSGPLNRRALISEMFKINYGYRIFPPNLLSQRNSSNSFSISANYTCRQQYL